ncbi:type II toxin-antitoxin system RelE/ParE family toxin [Lacicoccus alkaliphilus]|uniref:Plasmid stabilization system protein ParE n=1 Tax=Lacicoccus alkaliphilus DSM 16010 TaxID=1123231 RepID=A0A1M7BUX8_9BACL|nr:type II toxin-antitoxin system RelE/ParE family toxin [Salinicoccus alkaliphilus]SHL58713.1 Plasmid stabilization system protein ParE [Salinicoccus alkaliphilus DSM 16010]
MGSYKVALLPVAESDLDNILNYILIDDAKAAERVLNRITDALRHLETSSYAGLKVVEESLVHLDLRMIVSDPYIVFYRIIDNTVYIFRVLHEARDYLQILR